MQLPWLLAGDFNDIRDPNDKKGGSPFDWKQAKKFDDSIHSCGLTKLNLHGGYFT